MREPVWNPDNLIPNSFEGNTLILGSGELLNCYTLILPFGNHNIVYGIIYHLIYFLKFSYANLYSFVGCE